MADVEVVGVVAGGDLERPGAELGLDVLVGDDSQLAADQREQRGLPDQPPVAIVVRMHCDRGVGEHRLGAHGRDRHRAAAGGERIVDVVERVGDLAILDLEVGDRRAHPRIPVHQVAVAVDVALVVEGDEHLEHGLRIELVEREALGIVIARGAKPLQLLDDRPSVLLAPAPHALDERLAADFLAASALVLERALDLCLRRDPGVVGAEDPFRSLSAHPVRADQAVLDRVVQRVTHMQRAGHVWRRDRDRVVVLGRTRGLGVEQSRLEPLLDDARLDLRRVVAGL